MIRLSCCGAALIILTLSALSLHVPGAGSVGTPERYRLVVVILCASAVVYFVAAAIVLRRPWPRKAVWLVLAVALAMRLPLLVSPPFLSSDIFRYVWDGRVQAAGINPYRYIPQDPALADLRDDAIYPHINRGDYAPTIYPPAAQVLFATVARIWPSVTGMKLAMAVFDGVAIICLWRLLAMAGQPPANLLIYAWNPLPAWAFAGNGHVDAAVAGLVALALWARARRHDIWTGLFLGLAIATKFLPAVVSPALWRRRQGWTIAITAGLTIAVLYAFYIGVGWRVFGFLGGYGQEEGLDSGAGFWVLSLLGSIAPLPAHAVAFYLAAAAAGLAALGFWVAFVRRPDDAASICRCAALLMTVLIFAISPHYPWYFAWLAVPAAIAPSPAVIWLSAAPVLIYLDGYSSNLIWPSIVFAPAVLLTLGRVGWNSAGLAPRAMKERA
jgi:alpha-1,6-mannosyltransferase